ncbi:unnamed protein product [Cuscuta campestris]|uniref:F-box domain-containing protein n=1 Tax=Cuscuta campestris TaxID=132261 RepID=A0A484K3D1_9ASTE|nr:unnamed protein product [Cuscuta campestris]
MMSGEESLEHDFESLSVSKRLVRCVSQKLKKKTRRKEGNEEEEEVEEEEDDDARGISVSCLISLYGRGGVCRVGADVTDEDLGNNTQQRRHSSASNERRKHIPGPTMDCFSYAMRHKLLRRKRSTNNKKAALRENAISENVFIPDDILEMCLVRLPLVSLMNARVVCKKWKALTGTPRFWKMRRDGPFQSPWLFLFGFVKNGYCSSEIHALDVSLNEWHKFDAEILKGRFLFSVAGIRDDVYIVGGCSSLADFGKLDKSSYKTHKSVLVFSPITESWRETSSLKHARSSPVLGVFEVGSDVFVAKNQQNRSERWFYRTRVAGVSEVYEDPHRLSVRRDHGQPEEENEASFVPMPYKLTRQKSERVNKDHHRHQRRFVLIAVGGFGCWDEPLDSGEIYDSASNKWAEIQRLPADFGTVCSGVVCRGLFYVYSESDKLAAFDIETGRWVGIRTARFPSRVHEYCPKLISCDGRLFVLSVSWCEGGGEIGRRNKAVRKLWELDLMHLTWKEVSIHPDAPMDWNAVFASDKNLIFGVEMFKIFGQVLDFSTVCRVSETETKWRHVSRNYHVARELDASSCVTKSMAVLHL